MSKQDSEKEMQEREGELAAEQERLFQQARQRQQARARIDALNHSIPGRACLRGSRKAGRQYGSPSPFDQGRPPAACRPGLNLPRASSSSSSVERAISEEELLASMDWRSPFLHRRLGVEQNAPVEVSADVPSSLSAPHATSSFGEGPRLLLASGNRSLRVRVTRVTSNRPSRGTTVGWC